MSTVAGDFYDFQIKEESGVGILIADVSGHGVGAALIGSMLKVAFASQAECLSDPARVLTEINRILQGKMEESFVTACSLFIDIVNGRVLYANAGHLPPILWRSSKKEVSRFPLGGAILGPFPELGYENASLDLAEGDRLILYTDGIIETRSRTEEFFGDDRLGAFIEEHSSDSADCIADKLIEHLTMWSGRSQERALDDDLTLIVVDVVAKPDAPALGTTRNNAH